MNLKALKELWKPVIDYEGLYEVSSFGRVKSLNRYVNSIHGKRIVRERIRSLATDSYGYNIVQLHKCGIKRTRKVAILVATAFIPNSKNKPQVNHKDCNKKNDNIDNLEWCTNGENMQHAVLNNLVNPPKGDNHPHAKLNEKQVRVIKWIKIINPDILQKDVAKIFNIDRRVIGKIYNNLSWKHVWI